MAFAPVRLDEAWRRGYARVRGMAQEATVVGEEQEAARVFVESAASVPILFGEVRRQEARQVVINGPTVQLVAVGRDEPTRFVEHHASGARD